MTGRLRRPLLQAACAIVLSVGAAQAEDLFQSAPGPPAPKVRPQPQTQRRPAEPLPAPAGNTWDGTWSGTFHCEAYQALQAFSYPVVIKILNNRIAERVDALSHSPGEVGYDVWRGDIGSDGSVSINRFGVGGGVPGGVARGVGFSFLINGRFSGDSFTGTQIASPPRDCTLKLSRLH
jgi:hypothetical protein